jgi:hypothetical protein
MYITLLSSADPGDLCLASVQTLESIPALLIASYRPVFFILKEGQRGILHQITDSSHVDQQVGSRIELATSGTQMGRLLRQWPSMLMRQSICSNTYSFKASFLSPLSTGLTTLDSSLTIGQCKPDAVTSGNKLRSSRSSRRIVKSDPNRGSNAPC